MPAERARAGWLAAAWMIWGEWRTHPARVVVAALAIATGVALGFAIHLINASALTEFAQAIRSVNGDADLRVQAASPAGFDERLFPRLARLEGISGASAVVQLSGTVAGSTERTTILGIDPFRASRVTPRLLGQASPAAAAFDEDAAFLSAAALETARRSVGDRVAITAAGRTATFRIAGTLPAVTDQSVAVIDIATAQWRFAQVGRLQRVDLTLAEGVDAERATRSITAILPPGAYVATAETEARQSDSLSRAYRVNLNMLALVALLTGAFLVYSAQSLSVVRRTPQFALLRVLGTTRRALLAEVLSEGLLVGLAGALAGLLLGLALAAVALRLLGGDLGGGYFSTDHTELLFAPGAAAVFLGLGLAAALAGSLVPARHAARAQPAVALKNLGDVVDPRASPPILPALLIGGAAAVAALLPPVGRLPLFGYLAMALALASGVAAMPWLARALLAPLQRLGSLPTALDLALHRLWGAPSQAATALCGIVASTSLMIAMAVMVSSFRGSVDEWLTQVLPADLYLSVEGTGTGFDPRAQAALRGVPGVRSVRFVASTPLRLEPDRPPVALLGQDIDPSEPGRVVPLIGGGRPAPSGVTPVWISEAAARLYDFDIGDQIVLPTAAPGKAGERVQVAGVWRDYARQHGAIVIGSQDYDRLTGNRLRTNAAVDLDEGSSAGEIVRALRAALPLQLNRRTTIANPGEIRALSLRIFDRSFAVTYALEAVAVLVGLAGVATTFSAQTLARTREFGMLRHVGVRRGEVVAMLAAEGALLGAVGVVAGIGLGLAMSQILIHVINPQSFNWTMETKVPLGMLAVVAIALVASAAGTAVLSGRRALSTEAVRAVREDW